jgi:hypothetical protein
MPMNSKLVPRETDDTSSKNSEESIKEPISNGVL